MIRTRMQRQKEYDMGEASAVCNGSHDGKVVAVMTTDAEGKVVSLLLTYDTYDVAETRAPEYFVDHSFSVDVTIDGENMQTYKIILDKILSIIT